VRRPVPTHNGGVIPALTVRVREGRLLGGVCAGLARRWDVAPARVRLGFVVGSLLIGLGVLAYVAAWLILPSEGENGATSGQRGIVALAQFTGALLGLATLALAGAVATVFGYGWVIVGLCCIVLVCTLAGWARLGPAWALLPIGALTLPSVALAVGGVHLEPSASPVRVAPRAYTDLQREYKSGLGPLTLDLRQTQLPRTGAIELNIDAGVRRTLIALPHEQCVHVRVNQQELPFVLRAGALLVGEANLATPDASVFGEVGQRRPATSVPGPTLTVNFSSAGGRLVVRDYPDDIDPTVEPDWPGYPVYLEARPETTGLSRREAKRMVREWRARRAKQEQSKARIERLMDGPCAVRKKKAK
jgi:phage shock protein PspC (stress-responsive transcriptional regulator)